MSEIFQSPLRNYRQNCIQQANEEKFQVLLEESDLQIIAPKKMSQESYDYLTKLRQEIKAYSYIYPEFQHSLVPVSANKQALPIIQDMAKAAKYFGVGPFAAVAGTISEYMAKHLQSLCPKNSSILVENGGDLFICGKQERVVNLLLDPSKQISINILANDCAICVSSATIGHSLSFGQADFCLVKAKTGAMADAAATAYCNMLKKQEDCQKVLSRAKKDKVQAIVVYFQGNLLFWGDIQLQN